MGSIWFEEIEKGFIDLLKDVVTVEGNELPVAIRNPEDEFTVSKYPSATIFNYDVRGAKYRQKYLRQIKEGYNEEDDTVIMKLPSIPYDLYYQIDFWARYQTDINEMLLHWNGNIEEFDTLPVIDTEGEKVDCNIHQIDYKNNDRTKQKGRRLFQRSFTYRVWVELDERPREEVKAVLEREIKRREKENGES